MTHLQARVQFAGWLQENFPALFQRAVAIAENSINNANGLGQVEAEPTQSFWEKFQAAALGLGTTYLSLKNQRDAMKINLERAQAGLEPIDMATSAPVVRVQGDLSPELTNRLMSTAGEGIQRMLIPLAIGAVVLMMFMRKK